MNGLSRSPIFNSRTNFKTFRLGHSGIVFGTISISERSKDFFFAVCFKLGPGEQFKKFGFSDGLQRFCESSLLIAGVVRLVG